MKLNRKTIFLAVEESTQGTDPGSGYTGVLVESGADITTTGDPITRDILRDTLSPIGHVIGKKQSDLSIPLELRGAGDAGSGSLNIPEIDPFLKASLMDREAGLVIVMTGVTGTFTRGEQVTNDTETETVGIVADVDGSNLFIRTLSNEPADADSISGDDSGASATVSSSSAAYVYRPTSPSPESQKTMTVHYYKDGIRHIVKGAAATFTTNLEVGQIPKIVFSASGTYSGPTDTANPSTTYLDLTPRPTIGASLTIGDLDTSLVAVNAITFDIGNEIQPREDIQAADGLVGFLVTSRDPTGSIDPEVADLSDFNPFTDWSSNSLNKISVGIGSSFGERINIVMPATQYTELPYGDRNGIATYNLGYRATGSDDEMMIIYW